MLAYCLIPIVIWCISNLSFLFFTVSKCLLTNNQRNNILWPGSTTNRDRLNSLILLLQLPSILLKQGFHWRHLPSLILCYILLTEGRTSHYSHYPHLLRMWYIHSKGLSQDIKRRSSHSPVLKVLDLIEAIINIVLMIHLSGGSVFYNVIRLLLVVCKAAELNNSQVAGQSKPFWGGVSLSIYHHNKFQRGYWFLIYLTNTNPLLYTLEFQLYYVGMSWWI